MGRPMRKGLFCKTCTSQFQHHFITRELFILYVNGFQAYRKGLKRIRFVLSWLLIMSPHGDDCGYKQNDNILYPLHKIPVSIKYLKKSIIEKEKKYTAT